MNAEHLLTHFDRIADAPDAIPRLRRFILDLAVRSKLVPQDPNDEPASELLKRILTEKARLVKAGEIKKIRVLDELTEDEKIFDMPKGWGWVRLGNIATYMQRGRSPQYATGTNVVVVSQKCVQWHGLDLSVAKEIDAASLQDYEEYRFLRDEDLLWNSTGTGTIGRVVRVTCPPEKLVCDSHVTLIRCPHVVSEYIRIWLRSDHVYGVIEDRAAGSTKQVELTSGLALGWQVPLPPLAEQHRIVAKVDELMTLCDRLEAARMEREATRDRMATASLARLNMPDPDPATFQNHAAFALNNLTPLTIRPNQIKALRQTILNLAVRGKLVPQNPNDEPASERLKRIAADRVALEKNGSIKKSKPLPPVNAADAPFDLPPGWAWARFPEVGLFGRGKSKHRPRNDPMLYTDGKYPFIQTGDVARSSGSIETYSNFYNDVGLAQSAMWPAGTLCITIAANIADSGILSFDACFPDSVVGLIVHDSFDDARFFEYFIRTAKGDLHKFAPSTAQKNINLEILVEVLVPLPPLTEQHRIVVKVDELMALCDRLETSLATSDGTRGQLVEALLHKGLRGDNINASFPGVGVCRNRGESA